MSEQTSTIDVSALGPTVAELVGEGKKFKTIEDLARGKVQGDSFVEKLKTENAALREALESDANPDEILRRINEVLKPSVGSKPTTTDQTSNQSQMGSHLTEEKVLELLKQQKAEEKAKENLARYEASVSQAFGNKTAEVIATRLDELGMEQTEFQNLAKRNPVAALRLLGIKDSGASYGVANPSVNTEAYFGDAGKGAGEVQNFEYFQRLRRELKERYYEPHIQQQVFEARKKLGDKFWM